MADVDIGRWDKTAFPLSNVAAHASLLPNGQVLYWGRRSKPGDMITATLHEHATKAFILDTDKRTSVATSNSPTWINHDINDERKGQTTEVNLFCSGHCFQPDGKLLVVGGHLFDGAGADQACVYDYKTNTWTTKPFMNNGRWYPSALTLPDGAVLSVSGQFWEPSPGSLMNNIPQIFRNETWQNTGPPGPLGLYPKLHLTPAGKVFMAGITMKSKVLDLAAGTWQDGPSRDGGVSDYAPSVMYDSGKVIYIGGGIGVGDVDLDTKNPLPTNLTEIIDLNESQEKWTWKKIAPMKFPRRQHNATVLPDGTVLVTGGTRGEGFNNLGTTVVDRQTVKAPVHEAELWDPQTGLWTTMHAEESDRCYHGIALLLQDGSVLSAGGGEYAIGNPPMPNPPKDSLTNAQIYRPPYFFKKGVRPTIVNSPDKETPLAYKDKFDITVLANDVVERVTLLRLGSVTHSTNMNQSFMVLRCRQKGTIVTIETPANSNLAPPGHYMLFALNQQNLPCVKAPIIRIGTADTIPVIKSNTTSGRQRAMVAEDIDHSFQAVNERMINEQNRPPVVLGLTPICPYGLGPCWGGAHEALHGVKDIEAIRPIPSQENCVAFVYLREDILPDIDVWRKQFAQTANGSYIMRGFEMTFTGAVYNTSEKQLVLRGSSTRSDLILGPFRPDSKIEWDLWAEKPQPVSDAEAAAYGKLAEAVAKHTDGSELTVEVVGRLQKHGEGKFSLDVRRFEVVGGGA